MNAGKLNMTRSGRMINISKGCSKLVTADLRTNSKAADNSTFAIGGVQCSADTFVVNQSLVLRINTDCIWDVENPQLRQSQKRYVLFPHSEYHAY